jgi:hypothetical protein
MSLINHAKICQLAGGGNTLKDGANPDEATQTGIANAGLGCFVVAGARSQRSSRLLAMTGDGLS